jgi:hypothetical protein
VIARQLVWLGVSTGVMLPGCAPVGDAPAGPVRRDSAGIVIIENTGPAWPADGGWRLSPEPVLVIGGGDAAPEAQFDRIRGAVRLTDGTIVVADGRSNEMRYFTARGVYSGRAGGIGAGPGEFRHLTSIIRLEGDSVLAFDQVLWRITVFSPDRSVAREVSLTPVAAGLEYLTTLPDGRHLLANRSSLIPEAKPDGVHRYPRRYFRYAADGTSVDTVATVPGLEFEIRFNARESNWGAMALPFARNAVDAAAGGRWVTGDNARFELQERDADGRVTRVIRYALAERPLDDSVVGALERRTVEGLVRRTAGSEASVRRLFNEVPHPAMLPAFGSLHVTPRGELVVTEWRSGFGPSDPSPATWWVFDRDGVLSAEFTAPGSLTPMDCSADHVLGVLIDDFGVQRVALFAVLRGE